jgi:hypothetical protein
MADVSSRVVEQFVACLNQRVLGTAPTTSPLSVPLAAHPQEAPLDLGSVAVLPVLKRIAPFVLGVAVGRISKWRRRSHQ